MPELIYNSWQPNNESTKMTTSSRDQKGVEAKQEGDADDGKFSKAAASTSRQWSAFRNPRIVRVSRTFGGKDRHSKVCTIRGLRDRRIRLSVPTAIQLYDLQDRLGLSQPSKVIDWLLDVSKDDVDKLPPLQLPQGFEQFHQQMLASHELNPSLHSSLAPLADANSMLIKDVHGGIHSLGIRINNGLDLEDQNAKANSKYWDVAEASLRAKSKEVESLAEKGKWVKANIEQGNQDGICNYSGYTGQLSAQNFFPTASHSSLPSYSLLNNSTPINSYYHLDASNLSLSQFGSHGFLSQQAENPLNNNAVSLPMPSSLALSSGSQLCFCPPPTMSSLFPPFNSPCVNASAGDPRETNHFQLLGSSLSQHTPPSSRSMSSSTKPVSLSVNPGLVHLRRNEESHHGKVNNTNS